MSVLLARSVLAIALSSALWVGQQDKRVALFSYSGPPDGLTAMVRQTDVIVLGTVSQREQRIFGSGADSMPLMRHSVRLNDVLKGPKEISPGQLIVVNQEGGTVVAAGIERSIDDQYFPVFRDGEPLLLFLGFSSKADASFPRWGPSGAWRITQGGMLQ